jgi:hypothetical protein
MIDPMNVPAVTADEMLARYVLHSSHIRSKDQTLKQDAFVPHPYRDLSVTRHLQATEGELWTVGANVATAIGKTLYGRGDVTASVCVAQNLTVNAAPTPRNPNHADVSAWPADKPAQKIIALLIAAAAKFVARPA